MFLDPDGTGAPHVFVIVETPTRVTYGEQCMGHANEQRQVEGFLIPTLADPAPLVTFFGRFHGWPPGINPEGWTAADVDELATLISALKVWHTFSETDGRGDEPHFLTLDWARLAESTEAWVRVLTSYGPGVLVFPNSA